jgi:hypothetical protein
MYRFVKGGIVQMWTHGGRTGVLYTRTARVARTIARELSGLDGRVSPARIGPVEGETVEGQGHIEASIARGDMGCWIACEDAPGEPIQCYWLAFNKAHRSEAIIVSFQVCCIHWTGGE